jgi:phage shock protein E
MQLTTIAKRLCFAALMALSSLAQAEAVWIDVRTAAENEANGIQGDVLIPHTEIVKQVSELFPDKNTEIYLYCRSGNRSGQATAALKQAGYTAVSNAGSVGDARKQRNILD